VPTIFLRVKSGVTDATGQIVNVGIYIQSYRELPLEGSFDVRKGYLFVPVRSPDLSG
jgi:hypothetical protein